MSDLFETDDQFLAAAAAADTVHDVGAKKMWPEILARMIDVLVAAYRRRGKTPEEALQEARLVVIELAEYIGGQAVYLPRGSRLKEALRDNSIWVEWTGENARDLAAKHGVTVDRIHQIYREQRRLHLDRHQAQLFPSPKGR